MNAVVHTNNGDTIAITHDTGEKVCMITFTTDTFNETIIVGRDTQQKMRQMLSTPLRQTIRIARGKMAYQPGKNVLVVAAHFPHRDDVEVAVFTLTQTARLTLIDALQDPTEREARKVEYDQKLAALIQQKNYLNQHLLELREEYADVLDFS